jgi:protein O-GlcNAc transferase
MSRITDLNRRGVALKLQGRFDEAVACYEQAIRLQPDFAEAHFNLGLLWRDSGRVDLAVSCLERTVALRPDVAVAQWELGRLYLDQQRWFDAEQVFELLSQSHPDNLDTIVNLAVAWQEQGRLDQAAAAYHRVLAKNPNHAVAHTNLGHILKSQGRLPEAIAAYERAIAAKPELVEAHSNLGNSWLESGQFEAAYAEYLIAAELRPSDPRSHIDLGNVLQRMERLPDAAQAYRQAIALASNSIDAWLNLSHLLKDVGDFTQAGDMCGQLARRHPDQPIHTLRAAAVCPLVFRSRFEMDQYRDRLAKVTQSLSGANWNVEFARWTIYAPECPYNLQFLDGNLRTLKESFARLYTANFAGHESPKVRREPRARPRIGFVVTARHETAFLKLLGGVVERLDGRRMELVLLCSQLGAARIRKNLRRDDLTVVAFPERFDHIAATVRDTDCDLLYYWEVGNDPTNYFLPFLRLAPIQVTSWGIQVTTGIPNVDAYLSSDLVESADAADHYSEELIRASTLLTYQVPVALPASPNTRDDFGLLENQHVYGCVQNLGKFHPDFDLVLATILRADPNGVIVLARDGNGFAAKILQARWKADMADVASRIRFMPPLDHSAYLSLLGACDVLLDPLHFGGVTTTYDALALAQPVVTLPTPFHRGRYTAACLTKIGVTDTIARDRDDYVKIAVQLAGNPDHRRVLREKLQATRQLIFEDQVAVGEHERIFEELLSSGRCEQHGRLLTPLSRSPNLDGHTAEAAVDAH